MPLSRKSLERLQRTKSSIELSTQVRNRDLQSTKIRTVCRDHSWAGDRYKLHAIKPKSHLSLATPRNAPMYSVNPVACSANVYTSDLKYRTIQHLLQRNSLSRTRSVCLTSTLTLGHPTLVLSRPGRELQNFSSQRT